MKRVCAALLFSVLACRRGEPPAAASRATTPRPTPLEAPLLGYIDESGTGTPADSRVLRRRLIGDPATLNAVMQSGLPEQLVLQYVSRNLIDFDARMRLVPGLAERFDVSPDGRTFTFDIRREAVWEDGSPVTAAVSANNGRPRTLSTPPTVSPSASVARTARSGPSRATM